MAQKSFGNEYPAAMMIKGIRAPLSFESRFSRSYSHHSDGQKTTHTLSRFMDGSASITVNQLQREWPNWTEHLQIDFCQSCYWLDFQDDFPEMLRYIMRHGGPRQWSAIALQVAHKLPQQEAFDFLVQALRKMDVGRSSNIIQAIAETKHLSAETVLRKHLGLILENPALWDDSTFLNWVASAATICIHLLIKVGALPSDFTEQAHELSRHVCARNRDSWNHRLSKYYPEITLQN